MTREDSATSSMFAASQDELAGTEDMLQSSRLRNLILTKEKELHDINEYRIETLEQMLRERDRLLDELTGKMRKLKEDFQYNLSLIEERDNELDRYDVTFGQLKEGLREKEKEISELKMTISELEHKQQHQSSRAADMEASYQTRLKELRDEMDLLRGKQDEIVGRHREEVQALRFDLERQIREKNDELETQRREITLGFDDVMKERELETRQREEEMMTQLRQLERELALKQRALERAEAYEKRAMEEKSKVVSLTSENRELQNQVTRMATEHEEKMNELLETLHAVEQAFALQKTEYEQDRDERERSHEEIYRTAVSKRDAKLESLKEQLSQAEVRANTSEMALRDSRRELEDKLLTKARELDAQEAHFTLELERKENAILGLKTQLWNVEAELKQHKSKVRELSKSVDDKAHEITRLKEQSENLRTLVDDANRGSLARAEELRKDLEAKAAQMEEKQREVINQANGQVEAAHQETDQLRQHLVDLEAELLLRQERNFELQDKVSRLEQELTSASKRHEGGRIGASSPQFSEDMGPASPLVGMAAAGGGGGNSSASNHHTILLHQENENLRAIVADMRRDMEQLQGRASAVQGVGLRGSPRASVSLFPSYLSGGGGQGSRSPPLPAPPGGVPSTAEAKMEQMMNENKKLKEDNKKLVGTCDKLMEISNELNSRFNKLSGWMKADGQQQGGGGSMELGHVDRGGGNGGLRASPRVLVLQGGGGEEEEEEETLIKKKSQAKKLVSSQAKTAIRQPSVAPSKSAASASSSRHTLDDDFLLSGAAAPRSRLSRPTSATAIRQSERQSLGQKKVASRLKSSSQAKATTTSSFSALGRASLLAERKRLIRNWNAKD